jgi:P27 family predicted phage terminase small subunit
VLETVTFRVIDALIFGKRQQEPLRQLPPPTDFDPDHRDVWSAAQRQLRGQRTWENTDAPLLEAYVRNVLLARTARVEADRLGLDTTGGQLTAAAKYKLAADCEAAAYRYATALLLTPESRKKHGVNAARNGAEDELKALVG